MLPRITHTQTYTASSQAQEMPHRPQQPKGEELKLILVVEDDELHASMLNQIFTQETPYHVYCTSDSQTAWEFLQEVKPHLIVLGGHFNFTYGRVEARIKIPYGQGLWPAFWLLGDNVGSVGWPNSGEMDIMENIGSREPNTIHGTVHGPNYSGSNGIGGPDKLPRGRFADT